MEKQIRVNLGERSYSIHIGSGCAGKWIRDYIEAQSPSSVYIITNPAVRDKQPEFVEQVQSISGALDTYAMADGESHKNLEEWEKILRFLLEKQMDRKGILLGLGGGVVGDITGFAAAAYRRGVPFVQIPTTLLAMVDSSVGGKTGVNHALGKNLIGAFWQPAEVWIDVATLRTLPDREYRAGLAEVVKYAFIGGRGFFDWVDANLDGLLGKDEETIIECVFRSCQFKARVVEKDEREGGLRAILNYGHTFGHALEAETGYKMLLHGEAVTYGMMAAAFLSHAMAKTDSEFLARHNQMCCKLAPPSLQDLDIASLLGTMKNDKKVLSGKQHFIVAKDYGEVEIVEGIDANLLAQAFRDALA